MITEKYSNEKTKIVSYSIIGQNHLDKQQENQDSILFGGNENGCFLAVADGVSSAKHSKMGSLAAVESVKRLWNEICIGKTVINDLDEVKVKYVHLWKESVEGNWDEYATTINFIICVGKDVLVGQIGDGLLVVNTDNEIEVLTEEDEFFTAETYALGYAVMKKSFSLKKKCFKKHLSAYITTDGIGKEVLKKLRVELGGYLEKLITENESICDTEIERWIENLANKNGDDKSLGILLREA